MTDLFPNSKPARKPKRKLMQVFVRDYSGDCGGENEGSGVHVIMLCPHCDHKTDWIYVTVTEAKRGMPCPECN